MTDKQTGSSLLMTALLAGAFGLVAFGVAKAVGGWAYSPAVFVGVAVAVAVWVFLFLAFHVSERKMAAAAPIPRMAEPAPAPAKVRAPEPTPKAEPAAAPPAPVMAAPSGAPSRPEALSGPRGGKADDLKLIVGIGPKLEKLCHTLGFYHFDQIAKWTASEVGWVDENLEGFKGRVTRDKWVAQAKVLASGGSVADAERVHKG